MSRKSQHQAFIFYVDTRFERLARRPGAVSREDALMAAQSHVDELKVDFNDWLESELHKLSEAVAQIENDPSNTDLLDHADHSCSQLRDIGTTMGFELVTFVARSLCTILQTIKAGANYDKDMVDCHVNALYLVRTDAYRAMSPAEVPEMSSGLRRIVELVIRTAPDEVVRQSDRLLAGAELLPEEDTPPLAGR